MKARAGDRIVVASRVTGGVVRDGEIMEVHSTDGGPPYVVQWSDTGTTGLYFPGSDSHIAAADQPQAHATTTSESAVAEPAALAPGSRARTSAGHVRSWRVNIDLFEADDETSAHAVLVAESTQRLDARGKAHRNPGDVAIPEIGDEVAVARALRRLADRLLNVAEADIGAVEGHHVALAP